MNPEKSQRFAVEFPLEVQKFQADILDKRFEICRRIYNQLVAKYNKIYFDLCQTKVFRDIKAELKNIYERLSQDPENTEKRSITKREKELYKELTNLYNRYKITDFDMRDAALKQSKPFAKNIDSTTAVKIGQRLWSAWERVLFKGGSEVKYCKYGKFNSVEGKQNLSGIKVRLDYTSKKNYWQGKKPALIWNGLEIPILIDFKNPYEFTAIQNDIAFNRIIRRVVNGKNKYYVQIVFKGTPPLKINKKTGEIKHPLGIGSVGIDIGINTLAAVSNTEIVFTELADKTENTEGEIRTIRRAMNRSLKETNPNNFNPDGTVKKQGNKKITWVKSNHCNDLCNKLKESERKQAAVRKLQHYILVNKLLSMGNKFYIEKIDFNALKKRKEKTETKADGSFKSKKKFGRQIANKAPALLVQLLENKLKHQGGELIKVNPAEAKISKYNHITNSYKTDDKYYGKWDKDLNCQRDLYNAFLLCNMADEKTVDKLKCDLNFENFMRMHNEKISSLKADKNTPKVISRRI